MPTPRSNSELDELLRRSDALDEAIVALLEAATFEAVEASARAAATFSGCCVSLDHARGLRALVREALPAPAIGLMRLQYEALTRSVWLLYAAPDSAVEKLRTTLTPAAEKTAGSLPMLSKMLDAIEGKAPSDATQMLREFKDVQAGALNSYVHAGIHALVRQSEGYPVSLMVQVLRSSNGLLTMNGMVLAILSGDPELAKRMRGIQLGFSDCLPPLLPAVGK